MPRSVSAPETTSWVPTGGVEEEGPGGADWLHAEAPAAKRATPSKRGRIEWMSMCLDRCNRRASGRARQAVEVLAGVVLQTATPRGARARVDHPPRSRRRAWTATAGFADYEPECPTTSS